VAQVAGLDKKALSERDICTKFITPALQKAGWELLSQIREQVHFTKGRIILETLSCPSRNDAQHVSSAGLRDKRKVELRTNNGAS
jgi:type I site-specific restriction endonuclease